MRRYRRIGWAVGGLLLLAALGAPAPGTAAAPAGHYFPETGFTVAGSFWEYWQAHGGLAQQGYPLSPEFRERSLIDGRVYTVQYFERAVFERHPENRPPYDVLLAQLGTEAFERYGAGPAAARVDPVNPRLFPETGHTVGGRFRTYWEQHGGLAQQGYPVSDEFDETILVNGTPRLYQVQYFQRAVFEYHAENAAPYDVLLTPLGTVRFQQTYLGRCGDCPQPLTLDPAAGSCDVSGTVNGVARPAAVPAGQTVIATGYGFTQTEPVLITLTSPDGVVVTQQSDNVTRPGEPVGVPIYTSPSWAPGRWLLTIEGAGSHHRATIYFCVAGPKGQG